MNTNINMKIVLIILLVALAALPSECKVPKREWMIALWLGGEKSAKILTVDIGESSFNEAFKNCPVVRGMRAVYVRTSPLPAAFNAYNIFARIWADKPENILNKDFKLYDNIDDALADRGQWSFCNYNDKNGVGFPRDCGKSSEVAGMKFFALPEYSFFSGIPSKQGLELYNGSNCPAKISDYKYGGDSACTTSSPCDEGQGDCDENSECKGDLYCGIANCDRKKYNSFDSTDDCCQKGEYKYGGDSDCTTSSPCDEGQGDCDNNFECKRGLLCGRSNCDRKKYPSFDYTDDCCKKGGPYYFDDIFHLG